MRQVYDRVYCSGRVYGQVSSRVYGYDLSTEFTDLLLWLLFTSSVSFRIFEPSLRIRFMNHICRSNRLVKFMYQVSGS